ncbi:MAG: hypothetical protein MUC39_02760 [Candidatus Omnitrophica bacterium]|jgi:curli biogenesis system outer membrane secretion channel CsgG|nr:hypothetical protein [Candidatus Omnitrophota bacterium]
MKKIFFTLCAGLLFFICAGCAPFLRTASHISGSKAVFQALPPYNGPKAGLALVDFEVSAIRANSGVGKGLRDLLAATLTNSNRFYVTSQQAASASPGQPASDIIVSTALLEFEPQTSGGRAGVGGGGGVNSGMMGGLLGASLNKAYLVLEIRIIDAQTSQPIATTRLKGQASDASATSAANLLGAIELGQGISDYKHTPMEKAIRLCMAEAVRYIAQNIPPAYYKYR